MSNAINALADIIPLLPAGTRWLVTEHTHLSYTEYALCSPGGMLYSEVKLYRPTGHYEVTVNYSYTKHETLEEAARAAFDRLGYRILPVAA